MSDVTTDTVTSEIRRILADLYDAFALGDADPWADRLSTQHTPSGFGTDPQESWSGRDRLTTVFRAQVKEMHAAGMSFQGGEPVVDVRGDVAWVTDEPTLHTGSGASVALRLSIVLTREDAAWSMAHFHLSVGVPNETMLSASLTT